MIILLLILLGGVSFAPLLLPSLDIWHAQGIWVQGWLMVMFSWSFFENRCKNIPLGLLHLWVGLSTIFICYLWQVKGQYNVTTFFPYFNFLCLLILYRIIVQSLNINDIAKIVNIFKYVIIITILMCVLQILGLSQFFMLISSDWHFRNPVVGFIGNPTHLSGFLASTVPLFLLKPKRQDWVCLALLFIILCFTGTTPGEPSISGPIIVLFIAGYYAKRKHFLIQYLFGLAVLCLCAVWFLPKVFFTAGARVEIWKDYLPLFIKMPITGVGLGAVNKVYQMTSHPDARHLHMEYFQYALELGIVGLVLIGNVILDFIKRPVIKDLDWALKASVFGFLISCCFNYPSHLWLPSIFAIFCYAALHVKETKWVYQENRSET